ncbi:CoA pyrophosphatase [Nitrososphaera sp.]|uniref:NUDIX hydrolase n=1 Tax=Nitrososphaera sp. TaxID=1971748 RepID=UPI003181EA55
MRKDELLRALEGVLEKKTFAAQDAAPATPAAVLAIIHYGDSKPRVLLTKRRENLKMHRGEISFPGGRFTQSDLTLMHTALRETEEEIGLAFGPGDVAGALQPVRTMTSNHFIVPFVTVQDRLPQLRIAQDEVAGVLDAPLIETLGTMEPDREHFRFSKTAVRFKFESNVIWGATARILKQLHEVLIRPS